MHYYFIVATFLTSILANPFPPESLINTRAISTDSSFSSGLNTNDPSSSSSLETIAAEVPETDCDSTTSTEEINVDNVLKRKRSCSTDVMPDIKTPDNPLAYGTKKASPLMLAENSLSSWDQICQKKYPEKSKYLTCGGPEIDTPENGVLTLVLDCIPGKILKRIPI